MGESSLPIAKLPTHSLKAAMTCARCSVVNSKASRPKSSLENSRGRGVEDRRLEIGDRRLEADPFDGNFRISVTRSLSSTHVDISVVSYSASTLSSSGQGVGRDSSLQRQEPSGRGAKGPSEFFTRALEPLNAA